jgi:hypothetical protein
MGRAVTGRRRSTKAELAAIDAAILEYARALRPIANRQLFYQCVVAGIVEKTEAASRLVGRRCTLLREAGRLPWSWIVDETRSLYQVPSWPGISTLLNSAAAQYRRSLWDDLPDRVVICIEARGALGSVRPVADRWDVRVMPTGGFNSATWTHELAEIASEHDGVVHYYQVGDYDPSGTTIGRSLERKIREYASDDAQIAFERIALTRDQVDAWNLPTKPLSAAKASHAHARRFHDDRTVELDALSPADLRTLIETAIKRHITDEHRVAIEAEAEAERSRLYALVDRLEGGEL